MIRTLAILALLALAGVSCSASGPTYFGFEMGISNAPPPPPFAFARAPRLARVSGTSVYVVVDDGLDCDMFRYQSSWYVFYEGYWYRSRSYDGHYVAVDVRSVPRDVVTLPPKHWRRHPHGGPPGQRRGRDRIRA